jgi:hypothetical protein
MLAVAGLTTVQISLVGFVNGGVFISCQGSEEVRRILRCSKRERLANASDRQYCWRLLDLFRLVTKLVSAFMRYFLIFYL